MSPNSEKLAKALFDIGAIKFGEFKLKIHDIHPELPLSPIYVDLRILRSFPDTIRLAVEQMKNLMQTDAISCDVIAEIPTGATPIGTLLMDRTSIPMISPKKDTKTHGIVAKIEGVYTKGQKALVVDDLVAQSTTKVEAVQALREAGLVVEDVIVLVDRKQGGEAQLAEYGVKLHSVMSLPEMLEYYKTSGMIADEMYKKVNEYLAVPA